MLSYVLVTCNKYSTYTVCFHFFLLIECYSCPYVTNVNMVRSKHIHVVNISLHPPPHTHTHTVISILTLIFNTTFRIVYWQYMHASIERVQPLFYLVITCITNDVSLMVLNVRDPMHW